MTEHLFVYGTLMPDATGHLGAEQRARLAAEAVIVGGASIAGTLVDLGDYPGLIETGAGIVHGAVYRFAGPAGSLTWLDAYEDVSGGSCDPYIRAERDVALADGRTLRAWVYVYVRDASGRPVVSSGRWASRA
jgi:gamma-glutamylcyclotransferase (GGCT)/AIG2-like uncharacterized protein YtfP